MNWVCWLDKSLSEMSRPNKPLSINYFLHEYEERIEILKVSFINSNITKREVFSLSKDFYKTFGDSSLYHIFNSISSWVEKEQL